MDPFPCFDGPSLYSALVYVVDDDADTARLTAALLAREGYHAAPFSSAQAFLENLSAEDLTPRCLVTDLCMPNVDGIELQAVLAARKVRMPIIFMTGRTEVPIAVKAMKNGAFGFLVKPIHIERLGGIVAAAIEYDLRACERLIFRRRIEGRFARLTPRERKVLDLLELGASTKQVARNLGISAKTVFVHRSRVMEKLEVDNLVSLVQLMSKCHSAKELADLVTDS